MATPHAVRRERNVLLGGAEARRMEENMKISRASFGATVLVDSIIVCGGLSEKLDVDTYVDLEKCSFSISLQM